MENQNSTDSFQVNLDQFNGPLDLLLDLAKSQKVNLENISITLLADQLSLIHISEPTRPY